MKTPISLKALLIATLLTCSEILFSQGLITQAINAQNNTNDSVVSCGSHEIMKQINKANPGFMTASNQMLEDIQAAEKHKHAHKKTSGAVLQIPVVFHIVYNDTAANLHDSVIHDQIRVLNECYRRQNADTSNTRADFKPIVGDSEIEFVLATTDPNGNPTSGITRTYTNITHFGGVLPYDQTQTQQIQTWLAE